MYIDDVITMDLKIKRIQKGTILFGTYKSWYRSELSALKNYAFRARSNILRVTFSIGMNTEKER